MFQIGSAEFGVSNSDQHVFEVNDQGYDSILNICLVENDIDPQFDKEIVHEDHHCSKSIQLEIELQKARKTIEKLQIGCREKAAKINCLRKALNRSKLSNANLKDLLNDLKSREWISDEAHSVLSVK